MDADAPSNTDIEHQAGWAFDPFGGGIYRFEHFAPRAAEKLAERREAVYVIETVNWLLNDDQTISRKLYFAMGLSSALATAARMEIEWQHAEEDIVGIRLATQEEATTYFNVQAHFDTLMPAAISDEQAVALWNEDDED